MRQDSAARLALMAGIIAMAPIPKPEINTIFLNKDPEPDYTISKNPGSSYGKKQRRNKNKQTKKSYKRRNK